MKFKNPVSVVAPVDGAHATNKDYVDGKIKTITWAEYEALTEEEKNNGTLYDIPDMPTAGQGGIITTYTGLDQLGLSAGASVADIVNAMPDCSYAEVGCHREENPYGLEHVTGLPSEDGNFILTVRKYNLYRVDIQAKTSASGAVMNDLYVGGMLADGTTVEWRRVCTTTVKDVALTNIPLTSDFNASTGAIQYKVVNGMCLLTVYAVHPLNSGRISVTGLPIEGMYACETLISRDSSTTEKASDGSAMEIVNGELKLYFKGNSMLYYGFMSYPVKE